MTHIKKGDRSNGGDSNSRGRKKTLSTTDTSLNIVRLLQDLEGATLGEVTDHLDMSKTTAYYHLETLREVGYVIKRDRSYDLSPQFSSHGSYVKRNIIGIDTIERTLRDLADTFSTEAFFSIKTDDRLLIISHSVGGSSEAGYLVGEWLPLPNTSGGRAFLAEMPEDRVTELIESQGFRRNKAMETVDEDKLKAELERTHSRGYGLSNEEWKNGMVGISTVIHKSGGNSLGTISVTLPTFRYNNEQIHEDLINELQGAVHDIERHLSPVKPPHSVD